MPHSLQDYQIYPTPIVKDISILIPGDVFELDINKTGKKHRLVFERNGRNRIKKCTDIDDNQGWNIRSIGKVNVIGKREKLTKPSAVESLKSGEFVVVKNKEGQGILLRLDSKEKDKNGLIVLNTTSPLDGKKMRYRGFEFVRLIDIIGEDLGEMSKQYTEERGKRLAGNTGIA